MYRPRPSNIFEALDGLYDITFCAAFYCCTNVSSQLQLQCLKWSL